MDHEAEIIKNTQILHSDMQTLVYENYNKFISATDTIRKVNLLYVYINAIIFNLLIIILILYVYTILYILCLFII